MRVGFDSGHVEFIVADKECHEVGHTLRESCRCISGRAGRSQSGASGVEGEDAGIEQASGVVDAVEDGA